VATNATFENCRMPRPLANAFWSPSRVSSFPAKIFAVGHWKIRRQVGREKCPRRASHRFAEAVFRPNFDEHALHAEKFVAVDVGDIVAVSRVSTTLIRSAAHDAHIELSNVRVEGNARICHGWPDASKISPHPSDLHAGAAPQPSDSPHDTKSSAASQHTMLPPLANKNAMARQNHFVFHAKND
jgi:hypothetical protein